MKALLIEPGKKPETIEIENELKALQSAVYGMIEVVYPFDDTAAVLCNEEGKMSGMTLNRTLKDENGNPYDIIAGPFLVVGLTEDDFQSLTDRQVEVYANLFAEPEDFAANYRNQVD